MAYKKTGGRSVTVQPTGMPDLSGFFESARQLEQVGNIASSIGTDIRKREYNDLLRQAEIDGETSGAVYKKDKNGQMTLQPLVNFDYGKATQTYNSSDQKAILDAYRKSATRTYVSAASNDISLAAQNALDQNPDDPNGIRGALEGYLDGLSELDPQIRSALTPKAVQAFGIVENRALALQQKNIKENSIYQNETAYKFLSEEKGKLIASLQNADPEMKDAVFNRINEIQNEQDQIFESLSLNEVTDLGLTKLRDIDRTVVAGRVGQTLIKKVYASEGAEAAYQTLLTVVNESQENPTVDSEAVGKIGTETLMSLERAAAFAKKEATEMQSALYGELTFDVIVNGADVSSMILDPNSPIHNLDKAKQGALLQVSEGYKQQKASAIASANNTIYEANLAVIKSPELHTPDQVRASLSSINDMVARGDIGTSKKIDAQKAFLESAGYFNQGEAKKIGSQLQVELGPMSTYLMEPAYYLSEEVMQGLEKTGVIGKGKYFPSRKEYINNVEAYQKNYNERRDKYNLAVKAESKLKTGQKLSSKEESAHNEVFNFSKVRVKDQSGADVLADINLMSEDQAVQAASMNAVAAFAVTTKGSAHSEFKSIVDTIMFRPENADVAVRTMGQVMSALRNAYKGQPFENIEAQFYSNLDTDSVVFLRMASKLGVENTVNVFANFKKQNMNRSVNDYLNTNGITGDEDTFFVETFKESVNTVNFWSLMTPIIDEDDAEMYREMASNSGFSNTVGTVLKDPYIKDYLKKSWYAKVLQYDGAYDAKSAMHATIKELGKRVGLERNPVSGKVELVTNPILRQAQATVPNYAGVNITMNDVRNDFIDRFKAVGGMVNPSIIEGLNDIVDVGPNAPVQGIFGKELKGTHTLHFFPNESYGGTQTYTVGLRSGTGKLIPLSNNYAYDFKSSLAYKDTFPKVIQKLRTKRAKDVFNTVGLFDPAFVQNTFENIENTRTDTSLLPLINGYNEFVSGFGGDPIDPSTLTKEEVDDFFLALKELRF